jgi:hypothetical protein
MRTIHALVAGLAERATHAALRSGVPAPPPACVDLLLVDPYESGERDRGYSVYMAAIQYAVKHLAPKGVGVLLVSPDDLQEDVSIVRPSYAATLEFANRRGRVWPRGDRKWSLNDGQITTPNGVRVAPGTVYHRVEGNRWASCIGRVSELPPENPLRYDSQRFHRGAASKSCVRTGGEGSKRHPRGALVKGGRRSAVSTRPALCCVPRVLASSHSAAPQPVAVVREAAAGRGCGADTHAGPHGEGGGVLRAPLPDAMGALKPQVRQRDDGAGGGGVPHAGVRTSAAAPLLPHHAGT